MFALKSIILIGTLMSFLLISTGLQRAEAGEGDLLAATETAQDISNWLHKLKNPPKSVCVFSIKLTSSLDSGFSNVIEAELVKYIQSENTIRVVNCPECRTPQLKVKGDRILITKGAPDLSTLIDLGRRQEVESFLSIEV